MKKNKTIMDCPECGEPIRLCVDDECPYCGYDWILDNGSIKEPTNEELDAIEREQERNGEIDEDINNQNNTSSRGER